MTDYTEFEVDLEDLTQHDFGGLGRPTPGKDDIIIGVCAMKKKSQSKPMCSILERIEAMGHFKVVIFGEEMILNDPVTDWPRCHALIAFFSDGFPLEKAEEYAKLYKPFLLNEIKHQHLLKDRRHVMNILQKYGISTPEHVVMNRSSDSPSGFPVKINQENELEEYDDYIMVNGNRMDKPFVEKPVDGDNHNIYIYYPRSAGGGSCRLFRKRKNKCSEFYPNENKIRRCGSFIYEKFLRTEGSDVKVYTVTPAYAHSEARKSPSIDGVVSRNEDGSEVRYPILLNHEEKEIANAIIQAFGQRICGFDVLRSDSSSYVCDVNGWSFVKKNLKYYDDFALIVTDLLRRAMGTVPLQSLFPGGALDGAEDDDDTDNETGENGSGDCSQDTCTMNSNGDSHEELRCVIAVVRHGDRTPKQKLKIKVKHPRVLALFDKYGKRTSSHELVLKSATELGDVLKIVVSLIDATETRRGEQLDDSDCEERDIYDTLVQARSVLEMHGTFKGINRKAQLKPTEWDKDTGKITEAQFILKWGGVLTLSGRQQAEQMGQSFRQRLYPFDGLLRLHSTYRHDLKVYSSNEGRVQVTAAAFAKGMLQLEGHLTPILASLVRKSNEVNEILDDASAAKAPIEAVKKRLHKALLNPDITKEELLKEIADTRPASMLQSFEQLNWAPRESMKKLHGHISSLVQQLRRIVKSQRAKFGIQVESVAGADSAVQLLDRESSSSEGGSAAASLNRVESDRNLPKLAADARDTTRYLMCFHRWAKLEKDFYQRKKDKFDLSKIPDIADSVKYDLLHNPNLTKLRPNNLESIFNLCTLLADIIVPQEYGITPAEKKSIGSRISRALMDKIRSDLMNTIAYCNSSSSKRRQAMRREPSTKGGLHSNSSTAGSKPSTPVATDSSAGSGTESAADSNETFHQLDRRHARSLGIKSTNRMVRTRLYFTSESHLHSLLNVMRYAAAETVGVDPDAIELPKLSSETEAALGRIYELNYLTQIVIRLFEIIPKKRKGAAAVDKQNERVERNAEKARGKDHSGNGNGNVNLEGQTADFSSRFRLSVAVSPGVKVSLDKDTGAFTQGESAPELVREGSFQEQDVSSATAKAAETVHQALGGPKIAASPPSLDSAAYGPSADMQLYPCSPLIPLFKNIEYNDFHQLLTKCISDVTVELSRECQ